jgi:hypothetical protein
MDCKLCGLHILATMQIMWSGYPYHADCIGEAVAQNRAAAEQRLGTIESFEEEFPYGINEDDFDEFEDYENQELDDLPDVADEVLNQIPVSNNNGGASRVIIPEVMPKEVHINDVVANVSNQFAREKNGELMAHCGANRVARSGLLGLPMPEETDTFKPISHYFLVQAIEEALAFRHIRITKEEFAVTPDGMKFFAVLEVNAQYEGVNFAIGLRNSNDKSMRLGMVAGYKVMVCDNLSFAGEYKPMLAKHSKNLDLIESVSIAVDRLQRGWHPIRTMIDFKRNHELSDGKAREMLYRLFTDAKFPISLFRSTHREYFERALHEEFSRKTLWRLENAVTTSIKKLQPISFYENTAKLGKFITEYTSGI